LSETAVAIVTGASRGIGRAIALELAGQGAAVVVNYARSAEAAMEVVHTIQGQGGQATAIAADVSVAEEVETLVAKTLDTYGRIDVLVNNAGITRDTLLLWISMESAAAFPLLLPLGFSLTWIVLTRERNRVCHGLGYNSTGNGLSHHHTTINIKDLAGNVGGGWIKG